MKLTDHQQKMLDGAFGKGKAMAMQIQIGVGKCFDAERLVRAVAERGRLIEINNNSFVARPGCDVNCRKIARLCMQYDVRVCVDSDAHFCANVGEVPKALVFDVARALGAVTAQAPIAIGDVVLRDVCGTGVDVVAAKNMART